MSEKEEKDSGHFISGCIGWIVALLIINPYIGTCILVTIELMERDFEWWVAIIYGFGWPVALIDTVVDAIVK